MKTNFLFSFLSLLAIAFSAPAQTPCQAVIKADTSVANQLSYSYPLGGLAPNTANNWTFGNCCHSFDESPNVSWPNPVVWTSQGILPGKYVICLHLSDSASGCNSSVCDTVFVHGADCTSTFTLSSDSSNVHNEWLNLKTNEVLYIHFTWSWGDNTPNDTSTTFGPGPSHTYAHPGNYQICLTALDSNCNYKCSSTFCDSIHAGSNQMTTVNVRKSAPAGIVERSVLQHFIVYPNPASATSTVSFALSKESDTDIRLYDLNGRQILLLQQQGKQAAGEHQVTLNTSDLPEGTYLIRIQAGISSATRRLTISR